MVDDFQQRLDWLQQHGARQRDALRWHFVQRLWQRAQDTRSDAVRHILQRKLDQALLEFGQRLERSGPSGAAEPSPARPAPRSSPLSELSRHLQALQGVQAVVPDTKGLPPGADGLAAVMVRPELKSVSGFRERWSGLQAGQRLQQALGQGPEQAGPLNSHRLVLRSLAQIQALSPAYLQRFMAQADVLLWLERAGQRRAPARGKPKAKPRTAPRPRQPAAPNKPPSSSSS